MQATTAVAKFGTGAAYATMRAKVGTRDRHRRSVVTNCSAPIERLSGQQAIDDKANCWPLCFSDTEIIHRFKLARCIT